MLKTNKITKSFGKLCEFFFKKTCQKICTIQKNVLLLHSISRFEKIYTLYIWKHT